MLTITFPNILLPYQKYLSPPPPPPHFFFSLSSSSFQVFNSSPPYTSLSNVATVSSPRKLEP